MKENHTASNNLQNIRQYQQPSENSIKFINNTEYIFKDLT